MKSTATYDAQSVANELGLGVDAETVQRWAAEGVIGGTRTEDGWRFSRGDVDAFIESCRQEVYKDPVPDDEVDPDLTCGCEPPPHYCVQPDDHRDGDWFCVVCKCEWQAS